MSHSLWGGTLFIFAFASISKEFQQLWPHFAAWAAMCLATCQRHTDTHRRIRNVSVLFRSLPDGNDPLGQLEIPQSRRHTQHSLSFEPTPEDMSFIHLLNTYGAPTTWKALFEVLGM